MHSQPEGADQERCERQSARSGKAVASLFFGVMSFCIPVLPVIPALLLGLAGLREIRKSKGELKGRSLAIGGIVSSVLGLVAFLFLFQLWLYPAYKYQRESAYCTRSRNNLHQIGIAMHDYVNHNRVLPPAVVFNQEGKPLYSWRVLLLPYLDEPLIFSKFKLDEPWDSANNKPLLAQMPRVYIPPSQRERKEPFATHYQVFTGGGAIFEITPKARLLSLQQVSSADGTSKTLLVVEAADPVPWTKPQDLPYSPDQPLPKFGGVYSHGFNVLMADGSVRRFPKDINEKSIRAAITWNGGEWVHLPD
jgi:prepilin-type processing-associated H-X9-DG protein